MENRDLNVQYNSHIPYKQIALDRESRSIGNLSALVAMMRANSARLEMLECIQGNLRQAGDPFYIRASRHWWNELNANEILEVEWSLVGNLIRASRLDGKALNKPTHVSDVTVYKGKAMAFQSIRWAMLKGRQKIISNGSIEMCHRGSYYENTAIVGSYSTRR
jgi:hypothetical protein